MSIKVTIISINSKSEERQENVQYDIELEPQDSITDTLESAFRITNADDRPLGNKVCSTSTGDILIVNGKHFLVEGIGFTELTLAESAQIQKLTSRDTSFGYYFLRRKKLIN